MKRRYKACTRYTSLDRVIHVRAGDYRAVIYVNRLVDLPISSVRRIFKLMLSDQQSNSDCIRVLPQYIDAAAAVFAGTKKQEKSLRARWEKSKQPR